MLDTQVGLAAPPVLALTRTEGIQSFPALTTFAASSHFIGR